MKRPAKEVVIAALEKAYGNKTVAAKSLQTSRNSLDIWIKSYKITQDEIQTYRDLALDIAEYKLIQAINEGRTAELIFFLKTQGKSRGYVERQEVENSGGQKVTVEVKITEDDLRSDSVE
jgi:hypothetical protein